MIVIDDVHKRYMTNHGPGKWVLRGISLTIPPKTNVGLVGKNGAGKSTLLRLISGSDQPTRGKIERHCRVSWPLGFSGGLQRSLTGRQNAKFICRINGHEDEIADRLARIQEFAEIGDAFDEPVSTYSSGMQGRLKYAISLAFDFDVYISDELTAVGDAAFKKKAKLAFEHLATDKQAGLIMASHQEEMLKEYCRAGILLRDGQACWYDDINEALQAYHESLNENRESEAKVESGTLLGDVALRRRLARFRNTIEILERGIMGQPETVDEDTARRLIRQGEALGIELVSENRLPKLGCRLKPGAVPMMRKRAATSSGSSIDFYDVQSQCVKMEEPGRD